MFPGTWFAAALALATAAGAPAPLAERRAMAELFEAPDAVADAGGWRIGGRQVAILLDATFQEAGAERRLFVTQAGALDGRAGESIGAILYAASGGTWLMTAADPEVVRTAPEGRRGAARLQRLSAGRRGFLVQETSAAPAATQSRATLVAARGGRFAVLLAVETDYRAAGAPGAPYRGCGPSEPRGAACTRHASLAFVRGSAELDDAELELRTTVGQDPGYALPAERRRYVYDGERYVATARPEEEVARVVERRFADWLAGVPSGAGEEPGRLALDSRLGYVALGVRIEGDRATADAVPIETAVRGGRGRVPVRLARRDGRWSIVETGERASR